jgi:hypothetical protein
MGSHPRESASARKQGQRPLAVLAELVAGRAWLPEPAPS